MNFKRLLTTLATLLFFGTLAYGEIALKDLGNGQVEITFTFKDSSSEMGVIGSFDNWTVPGEAMTKNDAGAWEKTIQVGNADVLTYKFYSKGTWIFDERAPDKKDDGYGGFNGLIPVADILAGVLPAVPGAAPLPPPKAGPKVATRPKLTFGTETFIESTSNFATRDAMHLNDTGLTAKSIWKFQGDLIPGMPAYLEVTAFNGTPKFYAKDNVDVDDGLEALAAGFLFNPVFYLGGNKRPTLDKLRFGFDTPYLIYETGYGTTPLPLHQSILWKTVTKDTPTNDGYSAFLLGPKAKTVGDFTFDLGLVPNKTLAGAYGLYGWFSAEAYGLRLEAQLDHKSSSSTDAGRYFKDPVRQDVLLGFDGLFEGFVYRGQFLMSSYTKGSSGDVLPPKEKAAYKVVLGYDDYYGDTEVLFGYATRGGAGAQLLYLTPADMDTELGVKGTQTFSLNGFQKFGYWGTAKWESSIVLQNFQPGANNAAVTLRPDFVLDLDKLSVYPVSLEAFTKLVVNTKPAAGSSAFGWTNIGAKVSLPHPVAGAVTNLDLFFKADNADTTNAFHTLLGEAKLTGDVVVQAGLGYRTSSAGGFVLGANYTLPAPQFKSPAVYTQFAYNMDPYNGSGNLGYDLTDFGPTNAVAGNDGLATLRMGIHWNY